MDLKRIIKIMNVKRKTASREKMVCHKCRATFIDALFAFLLKARARIAEEYLPYRMRRKIFGRCFNLRYMVSSFRECEMGYPLSSVDSTDFIFTYRMGQKRI
ncbi:MAG: hypothetical protein ACTSRA_00820 [Promethearchaeota archaeon]|nr:MAG: hypothetical protein [Helarchaeota virus Nidhogg Meg22_1012]